MVVNLKKMSLELLKSRNFDLNSLAYPMIFLSWIFNLLDSRNFLSHFEQLKGFSSEWILWCIFKLLNVEYLYSHIEQLNGFSPVWILWFLFMALGQSICNSTLSRWMVSHQCEFFHGSLNDLLNRISCHSLSCWMVSHQCGFFHVSLYNLTFWMSN